MKIKLGKFIITEISKGGGVGKGHKYEELWDAGMSVSPKKFLGIRFLLWRKK